MMRDFQLSATEGHEASSIPIELEYIEKPSQINPDHRNRIVGDILEIIGDEIPMTRDGLIDQMKSDNNEFILAKDEKGKVIGYATLFPREDKSGACYLNKVAVRRNVRQRGVASKIIMETMNYYDEIILINTVRDEVVRAAMAKFYNKLGFSLQQTGAFLWTKNT